jgi:hypothetical protein
MGGGTSAGQAKAMNGRVANTISAAGTVLSDATALNATVNRITTVASGAGVRLFNGEIGDELTVYNTGANQLLVYPHASTGTINQIAAGGAMVLAQYTCCTYRRITSVIWIAHMSA